MGRHTLLTLTTHHTHALSKGALMPAKTPPATAQEVLAAFAADDHVATASRLAKVIWQARGGTGRYGADRRFSDGPPNVPFVHPRHVRDALDDLVDDGVLVTAVGHDANRLGPTWSSTQPNARYYGLAAVAKQRQADRDQLTDATTDAARALGRALSKQHIDVAGLDGVVTVRFTAEQALTLAATLGVFAP